MPNIKVHSFFFVSVYIYIYISFSDMAEQGPSNQSQPNITKPITVAIDFGTSNSGYAYEYTTGEEGKRVDVHVNEW